MRHFLFVALIFSLSTVYGTIVFPTAELLMKIQLKPAPRSPYADLTSLERPILPQEEQAIRATQLRRPAVSSTLRDSPLNNIALGWCRNMQVLDPRDALEDFIIHFVRIGIDNPEQIIEKILLIIEEMAKHITPETIARLVGSIAMAGGPKPFVVQAVARAATIIGKEESEQRLNENIK